LHVMSNNVGTQALIAEWQTLQQASAIECGYDGVLETKINYKTFRREHHIVVSDFISAGKTGALEALARSQYEQGGIGGILSDKVGHVNVTELCYENGSLSDLATKLDSITETMDTNRTTIHIFVSMLSSPGCPIENNAGNVAVWKGIARLCRSFKSRPYLVFNDSVIGNYKDPHTQNEYREFLGIIIDTIEEYCLVDKSAQFWDNLDRHVLGEDQPAIWRHCHFNVARQRVVIRLCPKQLRVNWGTHETHAREFFAQTKARPLGTSNAT